MYLFKKNKLLIIPSLVDKVLEQGLFGVQAILPKEILQNYDSYITICENYSILFAFFV